MVRARTLRQRLVLGRIGDAGARDERMVRIGLAADKGADARFPDAAQGTDEVAIVIDAATDRPFRPTAAVIGVGGVLGHFADLMILRKVALAIALAQGAGGEERAGLAGLAAGPLLALLAPLGGSILTPQQYTTGGDGRRTRDEASQRFAPGHTATE